MPALRSDDVGMGDDVQFIESSILMVCVDSAGVAQNFHRMFGLSNAGVVNGYIPTRGYMPVG